jgi:hypothetical protein
VLVKKIPKQFASEEEARNTEEMITDSITATTLSLAAQMILAVTLSISFKMQWNMVHTVQVLAFLRLIDKWPAHVMNFLNLLNSSITLDVIAEPV